MAHRGYVAQLEELHLGSDLALAWSCQLQHSIASQAEVRQVSTGITGTATPQLVVRSGELRPIQSGPGHTAWKKSFKALWS